jgi:hypothetical protein
MDCCKEGSAGSGQAALARDQGHGGAAASAAGPVLPRGDIFSALCRCCGRCERLNIAELLPGGGASRDGSKKARQPTTVAMIVGAAPSFELPRVQRRARDAYRSQGPIESYKGG